MIHLSAKAQSDENRKLYASLPPAQVGICRILHDRETARMRGAANCPYLSRFYNVKAKFLRGLPETVRFNGGKSHVKYATQWIDYLWSLNNDDAMKYLLRPQSGIHNYGDSATFEQLGWGGAYVVVHKIAGGRAYIESYDNSKHPSDYQVDYNQRMSVIDESNDLSLPDYPCHTFVIANAGETLWMDIRDLTFVRAG